MSSVRDSKLLTSCGLGLLLTLCGCKSPPPTLQEIGQRMDNAAQKMVDAAHEVIGKPRALPPEEDDEEPALERAREAYEAGKVAYQTLLARFQKLLGPSVVEVLSDAFLAAQLGNGLFTAQTFQHNADLLFCRELASRCSANVPDGLLSAVRTALVYVRHHRSSQGYQEPETIS